jgi:tRNA threonylcarbamoyladenosine biosynthesis protein TsaE
MVLLNQMLIATKSSKIDISSEIKTEEIAKKINNKIKQGDILFLYGEMGVGKTTFIKYLINDFQRKLGEKPTEVTSPTFNIMNEYKIKDLTIKHYDLYRLKSEEELNNLNLYEENNNSILLIEWPEVIKKKPNSLIELYFEYENDYQKRFLKIR